MIWINCRFCKSATEEPIAGNPLDGFCGGRQGVILGVYPTIEMLAEDGSLLYQNANPYVDPENFGALFADFSYTSANGDLTESQQESYSFPFGFGEDSCFEFRSDLTGRLDCAEIFPK